MFHTIENQVSFLNERTKFVDCSPRAGSWNDWMYLEREGAPHSPSFGPPSAGQTEAGCSLTEHFNTTQRHNTFDKADVLAYTSWRNMVWLENGRNVAFLNQSGENQAAENTLLLCGTWKNNWDEQNWNQQMERERKLQCCLVFSCLLSTLREEACRTWTANHYIEWVSKKQRTRKQ